MELETPVAEGHRSAGTTPQEAWSRAANLAVGGPLAWINFNLNVVRSDGEAALAPDSRKALRAAHTASRRLADMLDSLLVTQRIHSGLETPELTPVALATALEPEVRALQARAQEEEKSFSWSSATIGLAGVADERLLRRAFRLACGRAMDETPRGGKVRATATPGGAEVRLRITATLDPEDPCALAEAEPAEFAFARLAAEAMGAHFETVRSLEQGLIIDFVLSKPGQPAARALAEPAAVPRPRSVIAPAGADVPAQAPPPRVPEPVVEEPAPTGFRIVRETAYQFASDE